MSYYFKIQVTNIQSNHTLYKCLEDAHTFCYSNVLFLQAIEKCTWWYILSISKAMYGIHLIEEIWTILKGSIDKRCRQALYGQKRKIMHVCFSKVFGWNSRKFTDFWICVSKWVKDDPCLWDVCESDWKIVMFTKNVTPTTSFGKKLVSWLIWEKIIIPLVSHMVPFPLFFWQWRI